MEKKQTPKGKSYWNSNGAYQKEYDALYEKLVPAQGEANSVHGEMIRSISRLFYDFCNNGNGNAIDVPTSWEECDSCDGTGYEEAEECHNCSGTGSDDEGDDCSYCEEGKLEPEDCRYCCGNCGEEVYEDPEITSYYESMLDYLEQHMDDTSSLDTLREFMLDPNNGYNSYTYDDEEMKVYNDVCDEVVYQILTTSNVFRELVS